MSICVCSDVHGHYDLYKQIAVGENDSLYILGDMIDRGPASMEVLLDAMARPNVTGLLGNHELFMWEHIRAGKEYSSWMIGRNGGQETMQAFCALSTEQQEQILAYIGELYLQVELETEGQRFLLSHSAFLPDAGTVKWKDVPPEDVFRTVWYSPWRPWEHIPIEEYRKDGRMHIIGHVPVQRLGLNQAYTDRENHLVNIDIGCAVGYGLCCMNLNAFAAGKDPAFTYYLADS